MTNPDPASDLSNPLAQHLHAEKPKLVAKWTELVRSTIPAARVHDRVLLIDSIPHFIDGLVLAVNEHDLSKDFDHSCGLSLHHSEERGEWAHYSIDQIINEYCLLRKAIFDSVPKSLSFSDRDQRIVNEYLDIGIRCAASHFGGLQLNREAGSKEELKKNLESLEREKEMRESFVSALTHDLRNPLTAARMGAQLLARKSNATSVDIEIAANRIINNIDRADRMIRDLLDTNQIRAGKLLPLTIDQFDLSTLVYSTVENLRTVHGDRFKIRSDSEVKGFWSADGLQRVIENLCGNAIKYGAAERTIEVRLKATMNGVELEVHNVGNPIAAKEIKNLFDQFRRSEAARRTRQMGWGIGLTLVKGIVQSHGGKISVQSNAETGTTFRVELPRDSRPFQKDLD